MQLLRQRFHKSGPGTAADAVTGPLLRNMRKGDLPQPARDRLTLLQASRVMR
jgi:hypothetical protein